MKGRKVKVKVEFVYSGYGLPVKSEVPLHEVVMGAQGYSGQLLLQHNDLGLQFREGFEKLREAEELLDVTLACEDDTLDVHKVVMSASSPFFRKVLSKTDKNHPFIYMKGVKFEHLKVLIDFVYKGEVCIASEELDVFLEAAQELQITGLAADEEEEKIPEISGIQNHKKFSMEKVSKDEGKKSKVGLPNIPGDNFEFENKHTEIDIKQEKEFEDNKKPEIKPAVERQEVKLTIDEETLRELKEEIEKNILSKDDTNGGRIHNCKICGKEYKKRQKMSEHVETHLDKFTFPCSFCDKILNTRNGLRAHIVYNHTKKKTEDMPKEESVQG